MIELRIYIYIGINKMQLIKYYGIYNSVIKVIFKK